jgi:hypothetical protein
MGEACGIMVLTSWQPGSKESERTRDRRQDIPVKGMPLIIYFLQLIPTSYSFHHFPIVLSAWSHGPSSEVWVEASMISQLLHSEFLQSQHHVNVAT